jgi:hypothetical protein
MARLPYFVPPFSEELQRRTLVAHVARGFCFHITSPASRFLAEPSISLPLVLNVLGRFPSAVLAKDWIPLESYQRCKLLEHTLNHWQRPLSDLKLDRIEWQFMQLSDRERMTALDQIDFTLTFCSGSAAAPISWREGTMKTNDAIPHDVMTKLEMSLASLEFTLLAKDPMMPQHLRNVHSLLISYPETVHLLDDAEIARIIDAAQVHTKTEIVKAAAKGTSASGSRKKIAIDDL